MRLISVSLIQTVILIAVLSCSGQSVSPISPVLSKSNDQSPDKATTHLWGYYDVFIDVDSMTATAIPNRQVFFTANVVNFINSKISNLGFKINSTPMNDTHVFIDIDVSITHPFPGLPQYNGYDVRGIFMGDGSGVMLSNPDLTYALSDTDQLMLADSLDGFGGPDGYSRWFNKTEFSGGGMPLFQYTQGKLANPNYSPAATLNPYKYFADGLNETNDVFSWLDGNASGHGVFSSGITNTRNYYLRFPYPGEFRYGYAIIANWEGVSNEFHPSNAPESVACKIEDNSLIYFVDSDTNGGKLKLDISLFNWKEAPSKILIESTVLSSPYELSPSEMIPIGGNENYSTWHIEVNADNVTGVSGQELWVIAEQDGYDYSNEFGVPNSAENDPLRAYFRHSLDVLPFQSDDPFCSISIDPSSPSMPYEGWGVFTFDASNSFDPNNLPLTYEWDFNNDGIFGDSYESGTNIKPTKLFDFSNHDKVSLRLSNTGGGESICSVNVDITGYPSKNLQLRPGTIAVDVSMDNANGDLFILYADKTIYRRLRSEWYQNETLYIALGIHLPKIMYAMEINNANWVGLGITYVDDDIPGFFIYDDQQQFDNYIGMAAPHNIRDVYAMPSGTYQNDMGFIRGYTQSSTGNIYTMALRATLQGDTYTVGGVHFFNITDGVKSGINRIYYDYIQGAEPNKTGNYIWFLEDPDYYVTRWEFTEVGPYDWLEYNNAYFGTGNQTDADNGWNSAKDLTRDSQNRYFVLDELSSGEPRVKMWTVSGNSTASIGGFGNSSSIAGKPIGIEGSDFSDEIVILHGATPPSMLSVFFPVEMPQ